ncbi:GntR family transcriptional regulator [Lacrimispora aerotolerans]|uniref:GntR family transcriptional regulator n=1 Tax=Lacrimispora aerotolerans TaxID=36832 RepID=UPI000479AFB0|nr:GntR family transcriptional regulator [Lacrimispora aerotolerans]
MLNKPEKKTTADNIYSELGNSIIEMRIRPGVILTINDLAQEMNVSRSPVRDALIRLEREGLIKTLPQKGIMISKINLEKAQKEQYIRYSVEINVLKEFVENFTRKHISDLNSIIDQQEKAIKEKDIRAFLSLDDEFHKYFFAATDKQYCAELIWGDAGNYQRLRQLICVDTTHEQSVLSEHRQILGAIIKRDKESLIQIASQHLLDIDDNAIKLGEQYPELFEALPKKGKLRLFGDDFLGGLVKG